MSKRGRRRSSRRRKSSSSSKQSVSPYIFHKQNKSNSVSFKDDVFEKGETDSFLRENVPSASEDEEKYHNSPPKEKRFKQDHHLSSNQRSIYTKTTEDKEKGVKIVTSVSVSDLEDSPLITFQQLHQPLSESPTHSSTPVTNIMRINCSGSQVKLEIQEILQLNTSGTKTTFVFTNDKRDVAETSRREETWTPNNKADKNYRFTFGSSSNNTEEVSGSNSKIWDDSSCCRCCVGHKPDKPTDCWSVNPPSSPPLHVTAQEKRQRFHKSMDAFWDIPPPQEFADVKYNPLDDLTLRLQSCGIRTQSPAHHHLGESGLAHPAPSFDQFSDSDNYEPMFMRPSLSTNRSSFTKDFISSQKRKSWIRNNSIATVQHRACPLPQKRRQTFPGTSEAVELMQDDLLLPYTESFSSLIMCSRPVQSEELGTSHHGNDKVPAFGIGNDGSSKQSSHEEKPPRLSPFCLTSSEENADDVFGVAGGRGHGDEDTRQDFKQSVCTDRDSLDTDDCDCKVDQTEVADSGFDQDVEFPDSEKLCQKALSIQVIPPSRSGSEEQVLQIHPVKLENQEDSVSSSHSSSVTTLSVGALQQRFLQMDLKSSQSGTDSKPAAEETGNTSTCLSLTSEETKDLQQDAGRRGTEDKAASCPDAEIYAKEQLGKTYKAERHRVSRCSIDAKEHLRPVMHKEAEGGGGGGGGDHWAKRRKLFKDSKQWSSAGGSSITSDLTEESVSEDTRSMDMTTRDNEDGGFYMETFHSSAWIYQGDHVDSGIIPPSLNTRTRAVSIRERTVRISKGTGEYPWGFRIQFSKPIVVTEVDTNGAAEEAGLMVGDFVLAVNGTDVTSIPHSEAADLARQGPDVLTLTIGSDIACAPNTPRPGCRGYLHKRTQSGLIKGWRKRWFVLSHDSCLYYYRHKRDEGKRRALSAVKLEGAEVGQDVSLGKPFVFKCRPLSVNRVFFFCATSNQEMKRWLEAMERAIHPIAQNHVWVDVTRHNSSLPPLAMKNPECLGLLHKMDKNKDVWAQHYCILKDGCLYLYSGIRATHAHGGIYLQGYTVREQPYGSKKSTIELKPPSEEFKTFHLCSEHPNENKRWILAIKASVKKWLLLHQALQDSMNRPAEETRM
ncbi:uncharacterized protein pdzph1 isoform X1 [Hippoglossus stenolepis]|uniref:uncharacterized protein pdzph1 isoform X1 n=2 Tax=Hippoglossus stenolepis TaxID=195615 RepID=UPI001FAFF7C9|nr:uncharacterized protein pdzph1 isoform X1 [Hippoglossus stenolepis]